MTGISLPLYVTHSSKATCKQSETARVDFYTCELRVYILAKCLYAFHKRQLDFCGGDLLSLPFRLNPARGSERRHKLVQCIFGASAAKMMHFFSLA